MLLSALSHKTDAAGELSDDNITTVHSSTDCISK